MSYEVWGEPDDGPELPEGWLDEDGAQELRDRITALEAQIATQPAAPASVAEPVGKIIASDRILGWHMQALVPWEEIGADTLLYAAQPAADNAPQAPSASSVAVQSFPERNPSLENHEQGVFHKFDIRRVDGSDQPGGKHYGCRYFVLDMTHDAHAPAALLAYADSCSDTHPYLAADLRAEFATRDTATRAQAPDSAA